MFQDFLNFDRYLTPSLIRIFYILQVALVIVFGLSNIFAAFGMMPNSLFTGLVWLISTLIGMAIAIVAARIITEVILVLFKNNEHLAALRARAENV